MEHSSVLVEVSVGELLDKISILEIKLDKIHDPTKINNIKKELEQLLQVKENLKIHDKRALEVYRKLKDVNVNLWNIEDEIRNFERRRDFGSEFISLARKIYQQNDLRSSLKKQINQLTNSKFQEEKSYQEYKF